MTDETQQQTGAVRKIVTIGTEIILLDIRGYSRRANPEPQGRRGQSSLFA
jgi:hypothetical protein